MRILYFAWVRERVGHAEEALEVPAHVSSVADLISWLEGRGENYRAAFAERKAIRAAVNQTHVPLDAPLAGATEVAFFPPVTGG